MEVSRAQDPIVTCILVMYKRVQVGATSLDSSLGWLGCEGKEENGKQNKTETNSNFLKQQVPLLCPNFIVFYLYSVVLFLMLLSI